MANWLIVQKAIFGELEQHERDWRYAARIVWRGHAGASGAAALDDLHRPFRLRRRAAVALWPVPADGRLRPHLYFEPHRHPLPCHVRPLLLAHPRYRA